MPGLVGSRTSYMNPNKMHMLQSLFNLTTALHVSGVTITNLQEHKTTVTTEFKHFHDGSR